LEREPENLVSLPGIAAQGFQALGPSPRRSRTVLGGVGGSSSAHEHIAGNGGLLVVFGSLEGRPSHEPASSTVRNPKDPPGNRSQGEDLIPAEPEALSIGRSESGSRFRNGPAPPPGGRLRLRRARAQTIGVRERRDRLWNPLDVPSNGHRGRRVPGGRDNSPGTPGGICGKILPGGPAILSKGAWWASSP